MFLRPFVFLALFIAGSASAEVLLNEDANEVLRRNIRRLEILTKKSPENGDLKAVLRYFLEISENPNRLSSQSTDVPAPCRYWHGILRFYFTKEPVQVTSFSSLPGPCSTPSNPLITEKDLTYNDYQIPGLIPKALELRRLYFETFIERGWKLMVQDDPNLIQAMLMQRFSFDLTSTFLAASLDPQTLTSLSKYVRYCASIDLAQAQIEYEKLTVAISPKRTAPWGTVKGYLETVSIVAPQEFVALLRNRPDIVSSALTQIFQIMGTEIDLISSEVSQLPAASEKKARVLLQRHISELLSSISFATTTFESTQAPQNQFVPVDDAVTATFDLVALNGALAKLNEGRKPIVEGQGDDYAKSLTSRFLRLRSLCNAIAASKVVEKRIADEAFQSFAKDLAEKKSLLNTSGE